MRLSVAILASVLACSSLVLAAPRRPSPRKTWRMPGSTRLDAAGAVYFLSNDPNENQIISAAINSDGSLNLAAAIESGGRGGHGLADGPDPLFSQGSIKASKAGRVIAAVNAGSNTVSLFAIDARDPTQLSPIGDAVSSEGEFPISLAFNKDGSRLCVLNGGRVNGVLCYTVDKARGPVAIADSLRLLTADLTQSTPPAGPANTASQVVFSEDNTKLVVSVKGAPPAAPGFFAVWDVAADGALSADFRKVAPAPGGLLPFSMTVIPGQNAILATDAGIGFDIVDLNAVDDDAAASAAAAAAAANGTDRGSANVIGGQVATCWSTFSPATGNFYLTDIGTSTVTEVHVDADLKGTIVSASPQAPQSATIDLDIATVKGKDFIYVLAANASTIDVLSIDSPGVVQRFKALDLVGPTQAVGINIDPNNLQGMTTFVP